MTDHQQIEDLARDAVAVVECETMFEGLRFPSGDMLTIQLSKPRRAFAIIRRMDEDIHVLALHDDRDTAVRHAKEITAMAEEEEAFIKVEGQKPEGRLQ